MRQTIFLLKELVRRDVESRYAGSLLGFLWPVLSPLWQLLLFSFVFAVVMRIPLVGEATESFGVFLFAGLLPWLAVQEGISRSTTAVTDNANLVKNIRFRPELLVFAVVLGALVHQAIAAGVFVVVLSLRGELALGGLPLLLLALPLQVALTLGAGLLMCSIHTIFRDTGQVLSMALMGWFYLTPVVYPLAQVPERFVGWIRLNPLTPLVGLYRQALLAGELVWVPGTLWLAAFAMGALAAGMWLFRRLCRGFADEI